MTNYKWLLFLSILLSNSVLAEDREHHQEPVINVTGHAELIVPADAASLTIGARITAKTAKEAEAKGYQVGLKLKEVFKNFGIDEAALTNSNNQLSAESFDSKQQQNVFNLEYSFDFGRFDLIDSLREKAVEAGATAFNINGLISSHNAENKTKVRGLAYLDAKEKAVGLLSQSGFKLGKPLLIDDQRSEFPVYASARMLSDAAAPNIESKTPLLENRNIRFEQEVRVKFKIVE